MVRKEHIRLQLNGLITSETSALCKILVSPECSSCLKIFPATFNEPLNFSSGWLHNDNSWYRFLFRRKYFQINYSISSTTSKRFVSVPLRNSPFHSQLCNKYFTDSDCVTLRRELKTLDLLSGVFISSNHLPFQVVGS